MSENTRKVLSLKGKDAEPKNKTSERLHKVLAQAGLGSRRLLEERIAQGAVKVNGETAQTGQSVVSGDRILALCAIGLKEQGKLKKDTLVTTVMSNLGLHQNQTETQRDEGLEKVQQHRHRNVVWQVGHERLRFSRQLGDSKGVALDQHELLARCTLCHCGLELAGQLGVDLDRNDPLGHLEQPEGQRTEPRANLDHSFSAV